nr:unnamed protein product [Callosobruchus analis]
MELVGPSRRSACGVAFQAAFAFGLILVAGWGAIIKDSQLLQIIYGCHALLLCGHFWLMDESPRWLLANGRSSEAVTILNRALKMNKSPVTVAPDNIITESEKKQANGGQTGCWIYSRHLTSGRKHLTSCFVGVGAMCARTSGALTPLLTLLDSFDPKIPAMIFSVVSLISGAFVTLLPETLNKPMQQTIEDGEAFGAGDTCFNGLFSKRAKRKAGNGMSKTEMEVNNARY